VLEALDEPALREAGANLILRQRRELFNRCGLYM